MLWWSLACSPAEAPADGAVETPEGDLRYDYDDVGAACVEGDEDAIEVLVDFGDCFFCSENDVTCEIAVTGARIEVTAGGSVHVEEPCTYSYRNTCESVTARCSSAGLAPGAWTLAYAGQEVPVDLPVASWICTSPSAVLR